MSMSLSDPFHKVSVGAGSDAACQIGASLIRTNTLNAKMIPKRTGMNVALDHATG